MVQHPLIKKGTAVSVQPASQSAGYEEEQRYPPNPRLSCISYCNCSTLGTAERRDKAVGVKLGVAKEGSGRLKCGGKGLRWGPERGQLCAPPETQ